MKLYNSFTYQLIGNMKKSGKRSIRGYRKHQTILMILIVSSATAQ